MLSRFTAFCRAVFRRSRVESDMDAELRFHMDAYADDLARSGVPRPEAERRARAEFGGLALTKEDCRQSLGLQFIDELRQDLRYAARSLRKSPGFTAAAVVSLALGIGANTVIFSFVDAALLKAFPYREPDRLADIAELDMNQMGRPLVEILGLPARSQSLSEIAVTPVFPVSFNMTGPLLGHPERVSVARVTANYFSLLGVRPVLGRDFTREENQPGREFVALVSNRFWRATLGANSAIAGKTVILDGREHRIVGVLPPGKFDRTSLDMWIPLPYGPKELQKDDFYRTTGLLRPGISVARANSDLGRFRARARTLRAAVVRPDTRTLLLLLAGSVGFVMLIACANVANLMLARAAARQREVAIRLSTGASRARLVRQFLTESVSLALAGGVVGTLLAVALLPVVSRSVPAYFLPSEAMPAVDLRVLLFTLAAALATGGLFGMAPAWRFSGSPAQRIARCGKLRFQSALLVGEAALAMVLAAGAGLMIHSFTRLLAVDPGIRPERLLTWRVQFPKQYLEGPQIGVYQDEFLRRLRQISGIESAAASNLFPFGGALFSAKVEILGAPDPHRAAIPLTVTPEYLAAVGLRPVRGRWFTSADNGRAPAVAVVSEAFAKRYYGDTDPIGRLVKAPIYSDAPAQIVGVVGAVKFGGFENAAPWVELYLPLAQVRPRSVDRVFAFSVRTREDPSAVLPAVRSIATSLDRDHPIYDVAVMEDRISKELQAPRFRTILFAAMGGLALLLAVVGVYGVLHYSVVQRTQEIGIRMALGARRRDIIGLVLGQSLAPVAVGLVFGITAALWLTRLLAGMLFEVKPHDPATLAAVAAVVAGAALVAAWFPARRAAAIEPVVTLKHE